MSDYNIDSDDVSDLAWMSSPSSVAGAIATLIVLAIVYFIAASNEADCQKRKCAENLTPKVVKHDCLCVQKASTP